MAEPVIQGWCPGALRPMPSGDGWVVRVRPRGGRLTSEQAKEIARLAKRYGNDLIDLSSRANIQLRGVREATYGPLIEGLAALGLVDENGEAEARRNIVITPFWSTDDGTQALAAALATTLAAPDAPNLPSKFGFAIDCGPLPVLRNVSADIRLERGAADELICCANGAARGARVTADSAIDTVMALATWFLNSGGARDGRGRMAAHLATGAALPDQFAEVPIQSAEKYVPKPGMVKTGFLVGFEFGQMPSGTLFDIALLGALRVTPWRMMLIEDIRSVPFTSGLLWQPDDPRLRVIACTGAPGCPQALQPTRALARILAQHLPDGAVLHVSGCAKGCAHPGVAPVTLTAQADGFDLVRRGRAGGLPERWGLTKELLEARPEILRGVP